MIFIPWCEFRARSSMCGQPNKSQAYRYMRSSPVMTGTVPIRRPSRCLRLSSLLFVFYTRVCLVSTRHDGGSF